MAECKSRFDVNWNKLLETKITAHSFYLGWVDWCKVFASHCPGKKLECQEKGGDEEGGNPWNNQGGWNMRACLWEGSKRREKGRNSSKVWGNEMFLKSKINKWNRGWEEWSLDQPLVCSEVWFWGHHQEREGNLRVWHCSGQGWAPEVQRTTKLPQELHIDLRKKAQGRNKAGNSKLWVNLWKWQQQILSLA